MLEADHLETPEPGTPARRWYQPMRGRHPREPHRAATPLELLFDLCFVVAVSFAASNLHHALEEGHIADGLLHYAIVFFGIWWAWVNFTWFASAYDTDDVPYRLATFVQIAGVLILAAGVPRAFNNNDFTVTVLGYVVMRLALVFQWLRAAYSDPERRRTDLRYAIAVATLQVVWVALIALPGKGHVPGFAVLVACELLVPWWAESASPTSWHPHHIVERYGLFTLIVLGECILATTTAFQEAFDAGRRDAGFFSLALTGLIIVFSMWWLYFEQPRHDLYRSRLAPFIWGYGHFLIFSSIAATGAGLQVMVDFQAQEAHISETTAALTLTVPVAVFLGSLWLLRSPSHASDVLSAAIPLAGLLAVALVIVGLPVEIVAITIAGLAVNMAFVKGLRLGPLA
jgi:low temperature requirement protein LtrA